MRTQKVDIFTEILQTVLKHIIKLKISNQQTEKVYKSGGLKSELALFKSLVITHKYVSNPNGLQP